MTANRAKGLDGKARRGVGSDRGNGTTSDVLFNSVFTRLRCIAWCSGSVRMGRTVWVAFARAGMACGEASRIWDIT
jgi:hypothetical protein